MRDRKGKNIRVVLAEDHTLVRKGIKALLEELEGIDVVAEAGDGHEAINAVETSGPDIVLLDIAMSGLNGLEVASRITKDFPDTKVIVLSMHANEEYVFQSLKAGVAGYLLKDAGTAELELAIRSVIRGEIYLSPQISKQVVTDYMARTEGKTRAGQSMDSNPFEVLTSRQREITAYCRGIYHKGDSKEAEYKHKYSRGPQDPDYGTTGHTQYSRPCKICYPNKAGGIRPFKNLIAID